MKLANMSDSKSDALKSLRVQVPPSAHKKSPSLDEAFCLRTLSSRLWQSQLVFHKQRHYHRPYKRKPY